MKTIKIECDQCGGDITSTTNCADYRLALTVENKSRRSSLVTDMNLPRPLARDHYFCDLRCLFAWADTVKARWAGSKPPVSSSSDTKV